VPVYSQQVCFNTGIESDFTTFPSLFPDLSLFSLNDDQEPIDDPANSGKKVTCDVWQYNAGSLEKNGNSTWLKPDALGYTGTYKFYVRGDNGQPVSFRAVNGHNVVLGGSHYDTYYLDYISVNKIARLDDYHLQPPTGMPCISGSSTFGPKGQMTRSNPLDDLRMLFPQGHATRKTVFDSWASSFGKTYESESVRTARMGVYHHNLRFINSANRRGKSYVLAPNHMADWTEDEKTALSGKGKRNKNASPASLAAAQRKKEYKLASASSGDPLPIPTPDSLKVDPLAACSVWTPTGAKIPDNVDWVKKGYVNKPKDQGTCGSCWSYGTTGTIEGAVAMKTNSLPLLSEQNLLDCSWYWGNNACNGGEDFNGLAWILQSNNGSIASADSYGPAVSQYLNTDGYCHFSLRDKLITNPYTGAQVKAGAKVTACYHILNHWNPLTECNQTTNVCPTPDPKEVVPALNEAIASKGPISVSIDATVPEFYFYSSGWFYHEDCKSDLNDIDHTVLAVGYETSPSGQRHTVIRNSWSDKWGEKGYAKISQKDNNCGVATTATFVDAQLP
jgi:hypothetical protein